MEEELLNLIIFLLGLIYKLIRGIFRVIARAVRFLLGRQRGDGPSLQQAPQPQQLGQVTTGATPWVPATDPASARLGDRLDALARQATLEAARCAKEPASQRFCPTLEDYVVPRAREAKARAGRGPVDLIWAQGMAEHLELLTRLIAAMAAQRRDDELLLLLGDSDALAGACYGPILDHAWGRDLPLLHDHVATLLGDEDLAALVGPFPHGLAPVVLPLQWATEVGWWPAMAHEVAHCFCRSVDGLDAELRRKLQLPEADAELSRYSLTSRDLEVAFGRWLEEIFADAFGVMMLGPAAVRSAIWLLGSPREPQQASVCQLAGPRLLDEHPPPHLRVLLSCWLLGEMGYPSEADRYERSWRHLHGDPQCFYFPLPSGSWGAVEEHVLFSRAVLIVRELYEGQLVTLGDVSLRSIPGLDFGPHEHQQAIEISQVLATGHRAATRDPRCLIAGATLARFASPDAAAQILRAARATIPAVGVSRRRLRQRLEQEDALEAARDREAPLDQRMLAEAILLDAVLRPPPGRPVMAPRAG